MASDFLLGHEALDKIALAARDDLAAAAGPAAIFVRTGEADDAEFAVLGATAASLFDAADADPRRKEHCEQATRRWEDCDHEEMIFVVVRSHDGAQEQVDVVPKPWLRAEDGRLPHEHCFCGARVGADRVHTAEHREFELVAVARTCMATLFADDEGGARAMRYAQAQACQVRAALAADPDPPDALTRRCIVLASLLVWADCDFARQTADGGQMAAEYARAVLRKCEATAEETDLVAEIIRTSKGAGAPGDAGAPNRLFFLPRHVAWLSAWGLGGASACIQQIEELGLPLAADKTPAPLSARAVIELASPARHAAWAERGGESDSLVDYLLDVALQNADEMILNPNPVIADRAAQALAPFIDLALAARPGTLGELAALTKKQAARAGI